MCTRIVEPHLTVKERREFRPALLPAEDKVFVRILASTVALAGVLVIYAGTQDPVIQIEVVSLPIRFIAFENVWEREPDGAGSPSNTEALDSEPTAELAGKGGLEDLFAETRGVSNSTDFEEVAEEEEPEKLESFISTVPREIALTRGSLNGPFSRRNKMDRKMARVIFAHTSSWVLRVEGQREVEIRYQGYSLARAQETIRTFEAATGWLLGPWGRDRSLNGTCKVRHLTIYDLSDEQINDRDLMDFAKWDTWDFERISGLYDSTIAGRKHGSMFITASRDDDPSGDRPMTRARVIAHETAHYWQDRSCRMHPVSKAEKMAQEFERAFVP